MQTSHHKLLSATRLGCAASPLPATNCVHAPDNIPENAQNSLQIGYYYPITRVMRIFTCLLPISRKRANALSGCTQCLTAKLGRIYTYTDGAYLPSVGDSFRYQLLMSAKFAFTVRKSPDALQYWASAKSSTNYSDGHGRQGNHTTARKSAWPSKKEWEQL